MEAKQNIIQNIIYDDEKTQLINEFKEKIKLQPLSTGNSSSVHFL